MTYMCFTLPCTSGLCFDPAACFHDEFQKMWLNQMRLSEREDEKSSLAHTHAYLPVHKIKREQRWFAENRTGRIVKTQGESSI